MIRVKYLNPFVSVLVTHLPEPHQPAVHLSDPCVAPDNIVPLYNEANLESSGNNFQMYNDVRRATKRFYPQRRGSYTRNALCRSRSQAKV